MANKRKDGKPANHSGGRRTKAEEMGLGKHLNESFKALADAKNIEGIDGAEGILHMMWDKAHSGDIKAIQWIAERYFGKEPKAIIQDINISGDVVTTLGDFFNGAFNDRND